jgi:rare lipoprotein A
MKKTLFLIGIIFFILTGCSEREYETVVYPTPGAKKATQNAYAVNGNVCLLYTSPSPRD